MATVSVIAIKDNNSYSAIYCANDGYPEHQLKMLNNYYNDINKVKELISLGNIVILGKSSHSTEENSSTITYHKDRRQELSIMDNLNQDELLDFCDNVEANYFYIYDKENNWQGYANFNNYSQIDDQGNFIENGYFIANDGEVNMDQNNIDESVFNNIQQEDLNKALKESPENKLGLLNMERTQLEKQLDRKQDQGLDVSDILYQIDELDKKIQAEIDKSRQDISASPFYSLVEKPKNINEKLNRLKTHFTYKHNYANKIKIYELSLPIELIDIAYSFITDEQSTLFWQDMDELIKDSIPALSEHLYSDGRMGGYLILDKDYLNSEDYEQDSFRTVDSINDLIDEYLGFNIRTEDDGTYLEQDYEEAKNYVEKLVESDYKKLEQFDLACDIIREQFIARLEQLKNKSLGEE